jgi:hypothetical protein
MNLSEPSSVICILFMFEQDHTVLWLSRTLLLFLITGRADYRATLATNSSQASRLSTWHLLHYLSLLADFRPGYRTSDSQVISPR